HCKLMMVVRDDGDSLRRYVHIGTGNYHPRTARVYEDYGLLTTNRSIGEDVAHLFNFLSGYSQQKSFNNLLVSPHSVRTGLLERIKRESALAHAGKPALIRFKCNAIVDEEIIDALYEASGAGVQVDLLVRGICALKPGVPGLSDNIRVRSQLGRFLEHSRVYLFGNDGNPEVWLGSADLMHRNLDRRVEVLVSLPRSSHVRRIATQLEDAFSGSYAMWELSPDGQWQRRDTDAQGQALPDLQAATISRR
ncbi:MAG: RNA degradosome polyphosphate kinase, partial [Actinobacteria bacterium]|nr:RNA degradosome polyphosphate kinase [Actinomycetota bacterium]